MKKKLIGAFVFAMVFATMTGCKKKEVLDANLVGLGGDTWATTAIDTWISDNYTKPYNIEVKYKWDGSELDMSKTLVPVQENKVIPVMDAIKKTWIAPYASLAGEDFIKKLSQKQFVLVGSPQYNPNNTITLGEAEGGRKITLFVINDFVKTNKTEVKRMLHTIHHEFGHILNQNIAVTSNYQRITPDGYDPTWFNYTDAQARALGFITAYARSNKDDDFVEMLATMLVEGKTGFDAIVNGAGTGKAALLAKQAVVTAYMKDAFGIDVNVLQAKTETAINAL